MDASTASLEDLIAKLFIARPDVKAYQAGPGKYVGQYFTHIQPGTRDAPVYIPWSRKEIEAHLKKQATYGHYLLSKDDQAKIFAFDIDIDKQVELPHAPLPMNDQDVALWEQSFCFTDGREAWLQRNHPARPYMKMAMRSLAHVISRHIEDILGVPTLTAYTGAKGLHVYGFTGLMPAAEVRAGAMLVIDALPFNAIRGKMIYKWDRKIAAPSQKFKEHEMFSVEVFPKQDQLSSEDGFGNLMRLPLGRNQKSTDPTFFVDTTRPLGELTRTDSLAALRGVYERLQP